MQVVIRHRTRVRKLALVSATPAFVRRDDWPHALAPETLADFAQGLARDARQTAQRFVNLTTLGTPLARKSARELASLLDGPDLPPTAALSAGLELLRTTDLRRQVRRLDLPTLVIHGAGDVLVPVAAGRWLAGAIPGARLLEIAGAAHVPFASHGDLVAEALEAARG
jgi:pimeloyl-[acyl-carrier protein] methyl ester esterase